MEPVDKRWRLVCECTYRVFAFAQSATQLWATTTTVSVSWRKNVSVRARGSWVCVCVMLIQIAVTDSRHAIKSKTRNARTNTHLRMERDAGNTKRKLFYFADQFKYTTVFDCRFRTVRSSFERRAQINEDTMNKKKSTKNTENQTHAHSTTNTVCVSLFFVVLSVSLRIFYFMCRNSPAPNGTVFKCVCLCVWTFSCVYCVTHRQKRRRRTK